MNRGFEESLSGEESKGQGILAAVLFGLLLLFIALLFFSPKFRSVFHSKSEPSGNEISFLKIFGLSPPKGPSESDMPIKLSHFHSAQDNYFLVHGRFGTIMEIRDAGGIDIHASEYGGAYKLRMLKNDDYEYQLIAIAKSGNKYGWRKNYFINQNGYIRFAVGRTPNASSELLGRGH